MRTNYYFYLIGILFLVLTGCKNELNEVLTPNEQNLQTLYSLAKKYGYDNLSIECTGERNTLLTDDEILAYEEYFQNLEKIDGQTVKLTPATTTRQRAMRVWDPYVHTQGVTYDNKTFKITVYWKKDNATGDIFDVEGGLYGVANPWHTYPNLKHMMEAYSRELNGISNDRIYLTLKSDYITEVYTVVNGQPVGFPNYRISFKVAGVGYVDTNQMSGTFTINNHGEGSWGSLIY